MAPEIMFKTMSSLSVLIKKNLPCLLSRYLIPTDRQLHEDRDRPNLFNILLLETNPKFSLHKPLRKHKFKD